MQLRKSLTIIMAIVCALAAWELVLRNTVERMPATIVRPLIGRVNPGLWLMGTEGFSRTHFNSMGFRGGEVPAKQPGEYRVVVIGDSYVEGLQVSDSHVATSVLERMLRGQGIGKARVINAGRSSFSPAHYIRLAGYYRKELSPDATVVVLNADDLGADSVNGTNLYYVKRDGDTFAVEPGVADIHGADVVNRLPRPLRFAGGLDILRIPWKRWKEKRAIENAQTAGSKAGKRSPSPDYSPMISWIVKQLQARYPHLVIAYIPTLDYFADANPPNVGEEALAQACRESRVPLVDMRSSFLEYYKQRREPCHGFDNTTPGQGHINAIGHRLLARDLAACLAKRSTR